MMRKNIKKATFLLGGMFLAGIQAVHAAGPPAPSLFSNRLAVILFSLMIILLIGIGIMAAKLLSVARLRKKPGTEKGIKQSMITSLLIPALLLTAPAVLAQGADKTNPVKAAGTIGGMTPANFILMLTVVVLELAVLFILSVHYRSLLKARKEKLASGEWTEETTEEKSLRLSWWDRFNKLKPVSQEAELDLGHEYDGIRELNNKLPPWWLYGFYGTILFAAVYLWRFHVSHNGPSSQEEYERSVAKAELQIKEYLQSKGEAVDENTVKLLTSASDLAEGKIIFQKSCATCHKESGAGDVGPNLTDDYWLHGNDIKNIFKTIRYGINAMPQWQMAYSNTQIAKVASYVKSLHGSNPPNPKAPQGVEMKEEPAAIIPAADTVKKTGVKNP